MYLLAGRFLPEHLCCGSFWIAALFGKRKAEGLGLAFSGEDGAKSF